MKKLIAAAAVALSALLASAQKHVTTPAEAFGFQPGADRKLADWNQLTAYYRQLSSQSSRIKYEELGKTTEGRPFVVLTISASENLAKLDHYLDVQRRLADPRITSPEQARALIAEGKTIVAVTANIHSTEIASSQSVALFAYRLATENTPEIQNILRNVILVIVPSQNPDGQQLVVDWYKKYLGTPYEGSQPVVLWHHYTGHDDNRDWATFTQVETRLTTEKVLNRWHPQILYDIHQMGSNGPRIYLPPWVDPVDPNVDPLLVSSMNALGTNTALEISETGKQGVLVHGVYDFWSPLRDYISLHNGLRILTESASVNIASPIQIPFSRLDRGIGYDAKVSAWNFPNPWKGGWWRLDDIVSYQEDAFFSIARNAATYRERYLRDFYTLGQHQVERTLGQPYAWVIPAEQADEAAAARLVNTLREGNIEVQNATADFDAEGKHYAKGSYVVLLGQPFGAFAKTLLEVQHYPNIAEYPGGPLQRPYDVTAQTLPLLFGVTAVEIQNNFSVPSEAVKQQVVAKGTLEGQATQGYVFTKQTNASLYAVFALLSEGVKVYRVTSGEQPGQIYIPPQAGVEEKLRKIVANSAVEIRPADATPSGQALLLRLPRIGLYQSWVASMDEGWTRWIFDQNHIPYTRLVDADIRKGDLNSRFDAILLPDNSGRAITSGGRGFGEGEAGPAAGGTSRSTGANSRRAAASTEEAATPLPQTPPEYTGGLGSEGVAALDSFVKNGGTVIALNRASEVYLQKEAPVENAFDTIDRKQFYIPGSILQVSVDPKNPIAFGSTPTVPIFYENGPVFRLREGAQSIASFEQDEPLLSGWSLGGKLLKGTSAIAQQDKGRGHIILFGFRPQYRAISEVTYRFLFNALLYSASQNATSLAEQGRVASNAAGTGGAQ